MEVFRAAARNNTTIYTLDPRGLAGSEFDINDTVASQLDRQVLNESIDTLRTIASKTDGRAIVNRNEPMPELRQMIRDIERVLPARLHVDARRPRRQVPRDLRCA